MNDRQRYADLSDDYVRKCVEGHALLAAEARARGQYGLAHHHALARVAALVEINLREMEAEGWRDLQMTIELP